MAKPPRPTLPDDTSQAVVAKQLSIQQQQDGKDAAKSEKDGAAKSKNPPVQAGPTQQPEELSHAHVFLVSPVCASYITGIVLPVTGSVGE